MMTDSNRSNGGEIAALLTERRKFEAWLAALEARRASTPGHVFERVRADYDGRMREVEERLAAHRHSIQQERASLKSRRALVDAEEQLRRDERAELELRAHVGELSDADSESAFKAVDEALGQMKDERESLDARIAELEGLPETRPAEPEEAVEPPPAVPSVEEPLAEAAKAEAEPAVSEGAKPEAEKPEPAPGPVEVKVEVPEEDKVETEELIRAREAKAGAMHTPGGSFDELAFLTNVVGEKKKEQSSLLDNLAPAEAPLASNVPSNTPIKIRTSGAMEQSKTLKCTECGAMNYPTEWYCERCGAELAAL